MPEIPDHEPEPIADAIDEVTIRTLAPDLLPGYVQEKERHRQTLKEIDRVYKDARRRLKRYYGPVLEKREAEAEEAREISLLAEKERVEKYIEDLRKTILEHAKGSEG